MVRYAVFRSPPFCILFDICCVIPLRYVYPIITGSTISSCHFSNRSRWRNTCLPACWLWLVSGHFLDWPKQNVVAQILNCTIHLKMVTVRMLVGIKERLLPRVAKSISVQMASPRCTTTAELDHVISLDASAKAAVALAIGQRVFWIIIHRKWSL